MSLGDRIKKKMGLSEAASKPVIKPIAPPCLMPKKMPPAKSRLPYGSSFEASWDGTMWRGTINVPSGNDTFVCNAVHTSLTKLCYKLDDQYREWLSAHDS